MRYDIQTYCYRKHRGYRILSLLLAIQAALLWVFCSYTVSCAEYTTLQQQSLILHFTFESTAMGFRVPYMLYLPKGYESGKAYPVWYGLHGHSSSERMWLEQANIGSIADTLIENGDIQPLIMVFPFTKYDTAKVIQEDMKDGKQAKAKWSAFSAMN